MAYKMKGHELPGPNQRKEAPTKWINLVISGISAIAGAAKKNKERQAAAKQKATDSLKQGADGASAGGVPDATKSTEFKADMDKSKQ